MPPKIRILYFAQAARLVGLAEEQLELAGELDILRLRELILSRHPQLEALAPSLSWAIAEQIVGLEHPLKSGDTVAVLPPFSGG